ncbi:VOC family protein [Actinokineospora auranticolor]|nr:VOC family protein [Actinokineospora auranticolor]
MTRLGGRGFGLSGISVLHAVVVDCRDPFALARFWAALLEGEIEEAEPRGGPCASVVAPFGLRLDFHLVPEGGAARNRLHLDLRTTAFHHAVARAVALGATTADDVHPPDGWQVLRDPEGNEFCLLRPRIDDTSSE